jgi:hypothetical protein
VLYPEENLIALRENTLVLSAFVWMGVVYAPQTAEWHAVRCDGYSVQNTAIRNSKPGLLGALAGKF